MQAEPCLTRACYALVCRMKLASKQIQQIDTFDRLSSGVHMLTCDQQRDSGVLKTLSNVNMTSSKKGLMPS